MLRLSEAQKELSEKVELGTMMKVYLKHPLYVHEARSKYQSTRLSVDHKRMGERTSREVIGYFIECIHDGDVIFDCDHQTDSIELNPFELFEGEKYYTCGIRIPLKDVKKFEILYPRKNK